MSTTTKPAHHSLGSSFNLPNQLTSLRLVLSVVLFALIAAEYYIASLVLFLIAVGTDWLDGYYARKFNQITTLGRILDPFADKVIVCGTFIFLVVAPGMLAEPWGLRAWMVVVIVGRELLVTALRSFLEERGSDFSANMSGKLKMVLQSLAAAASLVFLHYRQPANAAATGFQSTPAWVYWTTIVSIWLAVALTVYSGALYVLIAYKLLKKKNRRLGRMTPLLATLSEKIQQVAILAVVLSILAACSSVWAWIFARRRQGETIIPLARRRPVPWLGRDVLCIFFVGLFLPLPIAAVVHAWMGPDAVKQAGAGEKELAHPAEQLLRADNPVEVVIAVVMAIVVAPLFEEFLFRVLLQGWLEALLSRRRRGHPEYRTAPRSWIPIVLPAAVFALMHFRAGRAPAEPQYLAGAFLAQMAGDLITLALAILILRAGVGATAADLGWKPQKLGADARLGLAALLAITPPVLLIQLTMMLLVKSTGVEIAPDPIPLFFLALVLGFLYRRTHRIAPSLVLHMAFNATSVALLFAGK